MSDNNTYIFINFKDNTPKGSKKLCVARMVNNEYTVVWDARTPSDATSTLRYDFTPDYYVAVAAKDDEDGAPKLVSDALAVTTGQTATYTGNGKFRVDNDADAGSRSFAYVNADPTNPTHAVLTQALNVLPFSKSSGRSSKKVDWLAVDSIEDASTAPTTPISFSPEVEQTAGTFKVVPRWNVYAGDGSGSAVDSLAFWWTEEDVKAGAIIAPGKIKGPSLTNSNTIVFDALPGSQINIDYTKTGWGQADIQPPKADDK